MSYRKASCLVLHELQTVLFAYEYGFYSTWHSGLPPQPHIVRSSINIGDLIAVFNALGIGEPMSRDRLMPDMSSNPNDQEHAKHTRIPIYGELYTNLEIEYHSIAVEIITPHLINVKTMVKGSNDSLIPDEFTHCGTFTVWWESE